MAAAALAALGVALLAYNRRTLRRFAQRAAAAVVGAPSAAPRAHDASNSTQRYRSYEGAWSTPMQRHEALLMLGFDPSATPDPEPKEVHRRHRILMSKYHADVGGPDVVCQKLNEARDLLSPKP